MEGILYVTDGDNKKRFVQIDLDKYGDLVEDMIDRLVIQTRRNEESIPLEEVMEELKESGNLNKYV